MFHYDKVFGNETLDLEMSLEGSRNDSKMWFGNPSPATTGRRTHSNGQPLLDSVNYIEPSNH